MRLPDEKIEKIEEADIKGLRPLDRDGFKHTLEHFKVSSKEFSEKYSEIRKALAYGLAGRELKGFFDGKPPHELIDVFAKKTMELWRLKKERDIDGLTGIKNKKSLIDEGFPSAVFHAERYGEPISYIMIDANFFKQINDTYGHLVGDEVLKTIAQRIKGCARKSDIVARYGGDEFCVVCPHTDRDGARKLGERIKRSIADDPLKWKDSEINMSVSVGIGCREKVEFVKDKERKDQILEIMNDLIKEADDMLYEEKKKRGSSRI